MIGLSQEQIQEALKGVVWHSDASKGGQHAGLPTGVELRHPDWNFRLYLSEHRSVSENMRSCLLLFELWLGSL